ncbi:putative disease resistance protein At3g14460 isoform X3 [Juglans microcarpa x Juglans regia]|uniref:putative disease resistance protein At3g14460 isoform X2 n=1 Tax=Juglans microcarpa x Juglans regia TaxID=2249226 RepID=UPI001B7E34FD|nr:putative disease resistance protein At3g14460 isoform X2 [Juglans microcarpa x Juglans regia]XP_040991273.1 putative disease resistance protein At3g14460 isoform X3 [Juglans microcarpa x Juglans regia]
MAVGELFLAAFLQVLFHRLASPELLDFARRERLEKKLDKWRKTLSTIQKVLDDAEEKELHAEGAAVKEWLDDLKDLAYDVEDILDEFATDVLRRKLKGKNQASTSKVRNLIPAYFSGLTPSAIMLRTRLESNIKDITTRVEDLAARKEKLNLRQNVDRRSEKIRVTVLAPTSLPNEVVYGRDEDKKALLDLLLSQGSSDKVSVIPIVGMGGIGKTTLAQFVYNDEEVKSLFHLRAWTCVSEDFDAIRVTKEILKSLSHGSNDDNNLDLLQIKLSEALKGKKFLVILDDLWNEDYHHWTILLAPFKAGAPGSVVIITTRNRDISRMAGTTQAYQLDLLSNDASVSIFTQHALGVEDFSSHAHLKDIGLGIVRKCKGLPLAAKILGGLLRSKQDRDDWEEVLNSEIWNILEEKSGIVPALMFSYYHLPSHLKRCFAYCSILPKDYEFKEKQVVLLWMAEGLIQPQQKGKEMEDLGAKYFHDLLSRSFFQQSSNDKSRFVMHDLINDLAKSVAGNTCFKKARHLSYLGDRFDGFKKFLRGCYLTNYVSLELLPKLRCLRVLSLNGYHITEVSDSIGDMMHLRYLDLSHTHITNLPESTTTLYNLQTLLLECCKYLEKLPSEFGNLVNLRHLNILQARSLKAMPLHIGKLNCLRTLSDFIVGKDCCSGLKELGSLSHLRGTLCISKLENVIEPEDARDMNLSGKPKLDGLSLGWSEDIDDSKDRTSEKEFLNMLQPRNVLKELTITCYGGTEFPTWLNRTSLPNLVFLTIENCKKCTLLPPLGKLASLRVLSIKGMASVKSIGPEICEDGSSQPFRSLETLNFENMEEWENWSPCESFSNLHELSIKNCPKLFGNLPNHLPSLEKVEIDRCWNLVVLVSSFPDRCKIKFEGSEGVVCGREVDFSSLKFEYLSTISVFESRMKVLITMGGLANVQTLEVNGCKELTHLWSNAVGSFPHLPRLRDLSVSGCPKLVSLVAKGQLPPTLEELIIQNCKNIQILVEEDDTNSYGSSGDNNTSLLQVLNISQCPSLKSLISSDELPAALQTLWINSCPELESIAKELHHNSLLKTIGIDNCGNLKSLPTGIHSLSHLSSITIEDNPSLDFLPDGELLPANLTFLHLSSCKKMQAVVNRIHTCTFLQDLRMGKCPCASFPEEGFPTNLTRLSIHDSSIAQGLFEWGLHKITSLKILRICDGSSHLVSFPEMKLPTSLTQLAIDNFPNLKYLSSEGFRNLTSLKHLCILNCEKLASFPKKGLGLPPSLRRLGIVDCKRFTSFSTKCLPLSLLELYIFECPQLEEWCKKDRGREGSTTAHIPFISFDSYTAIW